MKLGKSVTEFHKNSNSFCQKNMKLGKSVTEFHKTSNSFDKIRVQPQN